MTDTVILGLIAGAATTLGAAIAGMPATLVAWATYKQSRINSVKADHAALQNTSIIEKTDEIHALANANFSKATEQLDVAHAENQRLRDQLEMAHRAVRTAGVVATDAAVAEALTALDDRLTQHDRWERGSPALTHGPILVIDDNPDDVELVRHALQRSILPAAPVVAVGTLAAAVDYLRRNQAATPIQMAITDLQLTDADGLDVVVALHSVSPALPVIVLSGHVDEGVMVRARLLGAVDVVRKGADQALLDAIDYQRFRATRAAVAAGAPETLV